MIVSHGVLLLLLFGNPVDAAKKVCSSKPHLNLICVDFYSMHRVLSSQIAFVFSRKMFLFIHLFREKNEPNVIAVKAAFLFLTLIYVLKIVNAFL